MEDNSWFKIYRKLEDHWLFDDDVKFSRWIKLLMKVNWKESKFVLGNQVYNLQPGQSTRSLGKWALLFNCSKKSVKSFFTLLQSDDMIEFKTVGKGKQSTTLVTVRNFSDYQGGKETQEKRKRNAKETQGKREGNTDKEGKKERRQEGKNINIPAYEIFEVYAVSKKPNVNKESLKLKYESWKENGWKDGNDKPIKNWKSKLLNTIPHLKSENHKPKTSNRFEVPLYDPAVDFLPG